VTADAGSRFCENGTSGPGAEMSKETMLNLLTAVIVMALVFAWARSYGYL